MHEVLVNRLGGLSLPRKSVIRLTDRPDMTLDVYHGRKTTTTQQQQQQVIWVDIGATGSASDAAIFNWSEMKEVIENGTIGFPAADPLPNDDRPMHYFIIGDDAFPLRTWRTWLTKPFSRRNLLDAGGIFNYRLSRVEGAVENAFGILSNKGQVSRKDKIGPVTKINEIWQYCMCMSSVTENDSV